MLTKGDRFLILLILIMSLGIIFFMRHDISRNDILVAVIEVNGKKYKEIHLVEDVIGKEILVESEFGSNLIKVGDGSIEVIDASCPDKLDVKQGSISRPKEMIVCLPNRMIIEIKGLISDDDVDYIAR